MAPNREAKTIVLVTASPFAGRPDFPTDDAVTDGPCAHAIGVLRRKRGGTRSCGLRMRQYVRDRFLQRHRFAFRPDPGKGLLTDHFTHTEYALLVSSAIAGLNCNPEAGAMGSCRPQQSCCTFTLPPHASNPGQGLHRIDHRPLIRQV